MKKSGTNNTKGRLRYFDSIENLHLEMEIRLGHCVVNVNTQQITGKCQDLGLIAFSHCLMAEQESLEEK